MKEQAHSARRLAAGIAALPGVRTAFACTQAAWRFFSNERVTPPKLAEPLREAVRRDLERSASDYVLAVVDWSKIDYRNHESKKDRRTFCNPGEAGYSLTSVLAVDAATGAPLGPLEMELESAVGTHSTRSEERQSAVHYVEQVAPLMAASTAWKLPRRAVFTMDREYDSVDHYRQWNRAGHLFLVRADDKRLVRYQGEQMLLSEVVAALRREGKFTAARVVDFKGSALPQFVAEAEVVLDRPAWRRRADGSNRRVPGEPLTLRLVVSEIRDRKGKPVAHWLLFSNVPAAIAAAELALWYFWRWRIEGFFKLLKTAGVHLEEWEQENALRILRRLLVACMSCVTVWQLMRCDDEAAEDCKRFLIRLSGRQMKAGVPFTAPALLDGLHTLLVIEDVFGDLDIAAIRQLAKPVLDYLKPP